MGADISRINVRDNGLAEPGSLAPGLKAKSWQFSSTGTLPIGPKFGVTGKVGAYLAEQGVAHLIACGALGKHLAEGARDAGMAAERVVHEPDAARAGAALKALVQDGDVVLVKASRGMKMEQAVEMLAGRSGDTATGKQAQGH